MDVKILDDNHVADIMAPYMGGKPRAKRAVIAINMQGGGGFEIWNHQEHKPAKPDFVLQFGDLGCFAAKIKSRDVKQSFEEFSHKNVNMLGGLSKSIDGKDTFFIEDIFGNVFQIVDDPTRVPRRAPLHRRPCGSHRGLLGHRKDPPPLPGDIGL